MRRYRRRCPKCRRAMDAVRGPLVWNGHAWPDAVLAWNCVPCRVQFRRGDGARSPLGAKP